MKPTIYLFFKGDCLEAMTHYADTLGGRVFGVFRNGDAPPDSRMPGDDDLVLNMAVELDGAMMMASDNSDAMYKHPQGFAVHVEAASGADFDRIFGALANDPASILMPPEETFWAERFTMFRDRFGTPWMLSFTGSKAQGQ